jgi:hypothetical protein
VAAAAAAGVTTAGASVTGLLSSLDDQPATAAQIQALRLHVDERFSRIEASLRRLLGEPDEGAQK